MFLVVIALCLAAASLLIIMAHIAAGVWRTHGTTHAWCCSSPYGHPGPAFSRWGLGSGLATAVDRCYVGFSVPAYVYSGLVPAIRFAPKLTASDKPISQQGGPDMSGGLRSQRIKILWRRFLTISSLSGRPGRFCLCAFGESGRGSRRCWRMIRSGLRDKHEGAIEIAGRDVTHLVKGSRIAVFQSLRFTAHERV
jgi:hypothetical protein